VQPEGKKKKEEKENHRTKTRKRPTKRRACQTLPRIALLAPPQLVNTTQIKKGPRKKKKKKKTKLFD